MLQNDRREYLCLKRHSQRFSRKMHRRAMPGMIVKNVKIRSSVLRGPTSILSGLACVRLQLNIVECKQWNNSSLQ